MNAVTKASTSVVPILWVTTGTSAFNSGNIAPAAPMSFDALVVDLASFLHTGKLTLAEYAALKLAKDPRAAADKDTQWFSLASFKDGKRSNANVLSLSGFVGDLDTGCHTLADIREKLAGVAHLVFTTFSHSAGHPKYRVIVPYAQPVTAADHGRLFVHFNTVVFNGALDAAASDAARLSYFPSCCADQAPAPNPAYQNECVYFDPAPVLASMPAAAPKALKSEGLTQTAVWPVTHADLAQAIAARVRTDARFAGQMAGKEVTSNASGDDFAFIKELLRCSGGNGQAVSDYLSNMPADCLHTWSASKEHRMDWYLPHTICRALDELVTEASTFNALIANLGMGKSSRPAGCFDAPPPPAADFPAGKLPGDEPITHDVPEAQRLCTDLANAQRLQQHYRDQLIVCAGTFFAWSGTHWKINNGLARLFACNLSKIVQAEAEAARTEADMARIAVDPGLLALYDQNPKKNEDLVAATPPGAAYLAVVAKVGALDRWVARCESAATQDAALRILKDLLAVDTARLDADAYAFNCLNGTIDLRTGRLREHRAADLITKIAPTIYDPAAKCPRFLAFLSQIFEGDQSVLEFVQHFYGYAITGETTEQILLILWGKGSNGKTTLVELLASVIGDYASPAPSGLLTSKSAADNNYYAEIADLHGRRLVTASESEEGAKLKEAFMKKAVGGDTLKGRHLYGQLFGFKPTHTLQLLTNHKPQIRGADYSTWRRIRLLPFLVKFGTAEEVKASAARYLKDTSLPAALLTEREGVLAWAIEGAQLWHKSGTLEAPTPMLAAGAEYQVEQDRVGQFIAECCDVGKASDQAIVGQLYSTYTGWCRAEGLDYPLTKRRLMDELRTRIPAMGDAFKYKHEYWVKGIRIGLAGT
jgi:P4 family phage/plasmid primase-like protien